MMVSLEPMPFFINHLERKTSSLNPRTDTRVGGLSPMPPISLQYLINGAFPLKVNFGNEIRFRDGMEQNAWDIHYLLPSHRGGSQRKQLYYNPW